MSRTKCGEGKIGGFTNPLPANPRCGLRNYLRLGHLHRVCVRKCLWFNHLTSASGSHSGAQGGPRLVAAFQTFVKWVHSHPPALALVAEYPLLLRKRSDDSRKN